MYTFTGNKYFKLQKNINVESYVHFILYNLKKGFIFIKKLSAYFLKTFLICFYDIKTQVLNWLNLILVLDIFMDYNKLVI